MGENHCYEVSWGTERFGLMGSEEGICRIILPYQWNTYPKKDCHASELAKWARELEEYFEGVRTHWSLPLDFSGTPFQQKVWATLNEIPYGTTRTYGEVAHMMGRPDAVRAVARAIGQNPIPVVIPCHRVIGANGTLTGFRGGLQLKARLLALEGVTGVKGSGHLRFEF